MKKRLFSATLILALSLPFAAFAAEVQPQESTISVDYTINTDIAPDTAKIKFYVENSGINLADIKEKNDKIVSEAINEIKKKLNPNESVKTISFRVNNVYSYKDKIRIFQKYEVTNGFEVKLKDLNKISQIIKIAMDKGVKRVDNVNFSIEDGQKTCNELMKQAVSNAKLRAQILAGAAGTTLDKPKSINPYCSLNSTHVQQARFYANSSMKAMDGAGEAESLADEIIEPGTINTRASVNMIYYLK